MRPSSPARGSVEALRPPRRNTHKQGGTHDQLDSYRAKDGRTDGRSDRGTVRQLVGRSLDVSISQPVGQSETRSLARSQKTKRARSFRNNCRWMTTLSLNISDGSRYC